MWQKFLRTFGSRGGVRMDKNSIIEEAWACHEVLRRAGIPSEDIFVEIHNNVLVMVHQGDIRFSLDMGIPDEKEKFAKEWAQFTEDVNSGKVPDEKLHEILFRSWAMAHSVTIVDKMLKKGFVLGSEYIQ